MHGEGRPGRGGPHLGGPHVGARVEAEAHDPGPGHPAHRLDAGVVGVQQRHRLGRQVGHHLGLRALGLLDAAESAGVREAHLEDDADVGGHDPDQPGDVADRARAHLHDEIPGGVVDAEHRDRCPDLVVERSLRRDRRPLRREDRLQQVLGRGLAVRAGDRDDPQLAPRPHPRHHEPGQRRQRRHAVRHHEHGSRDLDGPLRDDESRARLDRRGREPVPVGRLARQREEDRPGLDQARVGVHAPGDHRRRVAAQQFAAQRIAQFGEGERDHDQPAS
jgi:hypothetical protein